MTTRTHPNSAPGPTHDTAAPEPVDIDSTANELTDKDPSDAQHTQPDSLPDSLPGPAPVRPVAAPRWTRAWIVHRFLELLRFGSVGGVAFIVDIGLFNLLRSDLLADKTITAKVISVAVATLVSWVGNRYWTFAERRTENALKELIGFGAVNIGGMLPALACLWVSHYLLGFTSQLADNISANGIGLLLGMVIRYFAYRHLVFTKRD